IKITLTRRRLAEELARGSWINNKHHHHDRETRVACTFLVFSFHRFLICSRILPSLCCSRILPSPPSLALCFPSSCIPSHNHPPQPLLLLRLNHPLPTHMRLLPVSGRADLLRGRVPFPPFLLPFPLTTNTNTNTVTDKRETEDAVGEGPCGCL
ncbi:hypothetical protein HDU96_002063, partial [Phlyctochytrium bullatum]